MANGSVFQSSTAYRPSNFGSPASKYGANRSSASRGGRGGRGNVATKPAYKNFMADRNAYNSRPRSSGGSFNLGNLGGLLGGRGGGAEFAEDNLQRQIDYDKEIWERSTPNIRGVGYNVNWDRDKNMVTSTLSEENQAIYDAMFERQKGFAEDVDAYSGDWRDIQQERFDQKRALYAESDAQAQQQRLASEQAIGASSTGRYMGAQTEQSLLNQRNMALEEQAFNESQGLIDSSLRRQTGDIASMMNLGNIANKGIITPVPNTVGNMAQVSTASTDWSDTLTMDALKKKQGQNQFWNSILGGISGSMFG